MVVGGSAVQIRSEAEAEVVVVAVDKSRFPSSLELPKLL